MASNHQTDKATPDVWHKVTTTTHHHPDPAHFSNKFPPFMGVSFAVDKGKWHSRVHYRGRVWHLGYHDKYLNAVMARVDANVRLGYQHNPRRRPPTNRT